MSRYLLLVQLLIAGCTTQQQASTCYKIVESVVTEAGSRALMQVPCPPGRSGMLSDQA